MPELISRTAQLLRRPRPSARRSRSTDAVGVAQDAPVAGGVVEHRGEHGDGVAVAGSCAATSSRRVCAVSSGTSPYVTTTVPVERGGSAVERAAARRARCRAARPGRRSRPRGATSARCAATWSRPWPTTTTRCSGSRPAAAATAWPSRVRPPISCRTLGSADFIRVPSPAARTTTAAGRSGLTRSAPGGEAAGWRRAARTPGGYPGFTGRWHRLSGEAAGAGKDSNEGSRERTRTPI